MPGVVEVLPFQHLFSPLVLLALESVSLILLCSTVHLEQLESLVFCTEAAF